MRPLHESVGRPFAKLSRLWYRTTSCIGSDQKALSSASAPSRVTCRFSEAFGRTCNAWEWIRAVRVLGTKVRPAADVAAFLEVAADSSVIELRRLLG